MSQSSTALANIILHSPTAFLLSPTLTNVEVSAIVGPTMAETATIDKELMERKNRRVKKILNDSFLPARMLSALMLVNFLLTLPDVEICRFESGTGLEDHLSGAAGDCLLQDLSREEEGPGGILRGSDTIDLLKKAEL